MRIARQDEVCFSLPKNHKEFHLKNLHDTGVSRHCVMNGRTELVAVRLCVDGDPVTESCQPTVII